MPARLSLLSTSRLRETGALPRPPKVVPAAAVPSLLTPDRR